MQLSFGIRARKYNLRTEISWIPSPAASSNISKNCNPRIDVSGGTLKPARVLIADDHEITRLGVRAILEPAGHFEFCGIAADGQTAVRQTPHLRPDLVVLDPGLPRLSGLEAARQIFKHSPQTSVLIFTEFGSEQLMREALQLGIKGYLLKSGPLCHLLAAAEAVLQGRHLYKS